MYAGLATGLLVASRIPALTGAFAEPNMAKGLLLAGGLVVVMGFVDDRWGLGALSKLAGQVAAGVILVWSGAEVTWVPLPGGGTFGLTTDQQTAATVLVVVITINAVNFIDGLDGLATGIVGIGAAAFFVYYYTLTHRLGLPDQTGPALTSAVLVGICLGFLPHNFYPARIFMGDTGAMLLGLLLAFAPISSSASLDPASLTDSAAYHAGTVNRFGAIVPLLLPAAILLIPYADLLMAVVRRTRAGTSPFSADKKHLHHRLLAIGHSHKTSVLLMYLWAALFAGSVAWLSIVRTSLYVLIIVTGAMMLALALLLVSMPRVRPWVRKAPGSGAAAQPRTATLRAVPAKVPAQVPAAAENHAAPVPAGPEATRPIPAAPWPLSSGPTRAPSAAPFESGPVPARPPERPVPARPPERPVPAVPPERPFARGPEPEPALEASPGPSVRSERPPESSFGHVPGSEPVMRQSAEPVEPAPWPGFAHDEPSGSARRSEPTPDLSASLPAAESRSWFEPAQPPAASGQPNGNTASPEAGRRFGATGSAGVSPPNGTTGSPEIGSLNGGTVSPEVDRAYGGTASPEVDRAYGAADSAGASPPNGTTGSPETVSLHGDTASAGGSRPNGAAGSAGPGQPDDDEAEPDQWSAPSLPRVDPRLPASLQDRH
jgi:UDP-GlcNAc:undecaprenyl-phosphate GlcNAc-1-phosphate transferase